MWPAFSHRWVAWRQHRLALPPVPFSDQLQQSHITTRPSVGPDNSGSPCHGSVTNAGPGNWTCTEGAADASHSPGAHQERHHDLGNSHDSSSGMGSPALTNSIPLLYGLSEHVVMRPGYWPSNVHCCGFWQQKAVSSVSMPLSIVKLTTCMWYSTAVYACLSKVHG